MTTTYTPLTKEAAYQLFLCVGCLQNYVSHTCPCVMEHTSSMLCDHCGASIFFRNAADYNFDTVACPYCQKETSNHFNRLNVL